MSLIRYSPKKPLELSATWRTATSAPAKSAEDKALVDSACKGADQLTAR